LKPLLVACTDLQNQLEEVRGKQATIVESKHSIVEQLDDIQSVRKEKTQLGAKVDGGYCCSSYSYGE
jgi:hypothetical protein